MEKSIKAQDITYTKFHISQGPRSTMPDFQDWGTVKCLPTTTKIKPGNMVGFGIVDLGPSDGHTGIRIFFSIAPERYSFLMILVKVWKKNSFEK